MAASMGAAQLEVRRIGGGGGPSKFRALAFKGQVRAVQPQVNTMRTTCARIQQTIRWEAMLDFRLLLCPASTRPVRTGRRGVQPSEQVTGFRGLQRIWKSTYMKYEIHKHIPYQLNVRTHTKYTE